MFGCCALLTASADVTNRTGWTYSLLLRLAMSRYATREFYRLGRQFPKHPQCDVAVPTAAPSSMGDNLPIPIPMYTQVGK